MLFNCVYFPCSGGHFGQLRLLYSTSEIDILDLLTKGGQDLLSYYDPPVPGFAEGPPIFQLNVSQEINALHACAASCLKEQACVAFSFTDIFGQAANCSWIGSSSDILVPSIEFATYRKNISSVATLLSNRATAGSDYEPTSGVWAVMHEGDAFANLSVLIQTDAVAELDEKFAISLLNVELLNVKVIPENQPTVGQPNTSTVIIAMNGDVFGIFLLYIANVNATEKGSYLEVREETRLAVQLVVDRSGGSLGEVTVEWNVVGGTARKNIDFIGDGEILTFAEGRMDVNV